MLFVTRKITITRKELLNKETDRALTQDGNDTNEKPTEQVLCAMVERMIENNEEVV